ncbi:AI-2E family transporter [Ruegeria sp. 2012CJ41-6]|uniref:AI-2E family transporter n=1 Tax=Ruegeria spongiae TaxID=2942209 RepID=A0ABT0PWW3_9RHOB|nr:AI-2E family transporter [Ruegeria spongiae]MCL6282078.1 AI-2E family transporter [Ruegeria spongiae]
MSFNPDENSDPPQTAPARSEGLHPKLSMCRDVSVVIAVVVFGLYAGSGFLIPLVLALLAYVLIIAVSDHILDVLPLPVWFANILAVIVVLAGLFMIMYVLGSQATQMVRNFSNYENAFDNALHKLVALVGNDVTQYIHDSLVNIDMSFVARSAVGGATSFLSTFVLISLYVGFLMAERLMFRRKILLAANDKVFGQKLSAVMTAITRSLQSYVGVKSLVSAMTALISYSVFRWLGLEYAETWAVLTFGLNFIPNIGSIVAVVFPALIALVQFDSLTPFLVILFFCGTVQFLMGNFLDPALLGRSLNMSTFMVIISLTFWSSVWGVVGAFLSVPVTVCLLIVFSHIKALRPVAILMSKDGTIFDSDTERTS